MPALPLGASRPNRHNEARAVPDLDFARRILGLIPTHRTAGGGRGACRRGACAHLVELFTRRRKPRRSSGPNQHAYERLWHQLPLEGRETLQLIRAGGPFPYPRNDGVTYFNRNGQLPAESRNYYKEYTVITPGSSTRGARRLVVGAGGEIYYTQDHYDTFRRVMEGR